MDAVAFWPHPRIHRTHKNTETQSMTPTKTMLALLLAASFAPGHAADLKIALITGKTGALEPYAKETETGFMLGLEYLTGGKMEIGGRKLKIIVKDDQSKPDLGRTLLAEAYGDDKVDIAVGTSSSGSALAMLPVELVPTAMSTLSSP